MIPERLTFQLSGVNPWQMSVGFLMKRQSNNLTKVVTFQEEPWQKGDRRNLNKTSKF